MLLGNVIAMQHEQASTFSVSGNTQPQAPLSVSKGSRIAVKVTSSPDSITPIDQTQKAAIQSDLVSACRGLGISPNSSGGHVLEAQILRTASEGKWISVELTLKRGGSRRTNKGFLITKGKKARNGHYKIVEPLQEALGRMMIIK